MNAQPHQRSLFDDPRPAPAPAFGGETYEPEHDAKRFGAQLDAVYRIMRDGRWWTLADVATEAARRVGRTCSEAAVSARIRDLRKPEFGGHTVNRRRSAVHNGLFEYQLIDAATRKPR